MCVCVCACTCMCMCAHMYMCRNVYMSEGIFSSQRWQVPLSWSYCHLWDAWYRCWAPNSDTLEEENGLFLSTSPYPSPLGGVLGYGAWGHPDNCPIVDWLWQMVCLELFVCCCFFFFSVDISYLAPANFYPINFNMEEINLVFKMLIILPD